jgi:hypothetical protein
MPGFNESLVNIIKVKTEHRLYVAAMLPHLLHPRKEDVQVF